MFSIKYEAESSNRLLHSLEHALGAIGLWSPEVTIKYLVVNNYWIPTNSESPGEAIRIYYRDNQDLASTSMCRDPG